MNVTEKYRSSLYAGIIGDALGVPLEIGTRNEPTLCSVKNMFGFGRYDQPKGTWADDTSMILCTMESLCRGFDIEDIGHTFCSWLFDGRWTVNGYAFDAGITTVTALENIRSKTYTTRDAGGQGIDDNGNGSLMRMLPAALYFASEDIDSFLDKVHAVSAITHAHPRAKMGCGIYCLIVRRLLAMDNKIEAFHAAIDDALAYYKKNSGFKNEVSHYFRILSKDIIALDADQIYSSGYIVHTLETALWCFLHNNNTKDILLGAINFGLDTDTNGTAAGGLAGLAHGLEGISSDWIHSLAEKESIDSLISEFISMLTSRNGTGRI